MKEKTKMIPGCVNPLAVGEHNMNDNIITNHEQLNNILKDWLLGK